MAQMTLCFARSAAISCRRPGGGTWRGIVCDAIRRLGRRSQE
jgi:hypothetical protein